MKDKANLPLRVSRALKWIIPVLLDNNIPYQISGGVATRFYGATREINDIDIDIPERYFPKLYKLLKDNTIFGPEKFIDSEWILILMQVEYEGQLIELCSGDNQQIYNEETEEWEKYVYNFKDQVTMSWKNLSLKIITPESLRYYKRLLHGEKQAEDRRVLARYIENKLAK